MKTLVSFLIIAISLSSCNSCTKKRKSEGYKTLSENKFDFSDFKQVYHKGLKIQIPNYFVQDYNSSYQYKKNEFSLAAFDAGIFFSCEHFDLNEVSDYKFAFKEGTTNLDALHKFYIAQRMSSLSEAKLSAMKQKEFSKNIFANYQIIESGNYNSMVYMTATIEKTEAGDAKYYVIQLIAAKEMAAYLLDDFKSLLKNLK
jgi:hypothetical protein